MPDMQEKYLKINPYNFLYVKLKNENLCENSGHFIANTIFNWISLELRDKTFYLPNEHFEKGLQKERTKWPYLL